MTYPLPISSAATGQAVSQELLPLSGNLLLKHILEDDRPEALIRSLPGEDSFWIVKRKCPPSVVFLVLFACYFNYYGVDKLLRFFPRK